MNLVPVLVADVEPEDVVTQWQHMDAGTRGSLVVVISLFLVSLLALAFVLILRKARKKRRPRQHIHRRSDESTETSLPEDGGDSGSQSSERGSRRRRRAHRALNPTRAETGGLPPIRTEGRRDPPL